MQKILDIITAKMQRVSSVRTALEAGYYIIVGCQYIHHFTFSVCTYRNTAAAMANDTI